MDYDTRLGRVRSWVQIPASAKVDEVGDVQENLSIPQNASTQFSWWRYFLMITMIAPMSIPMASAKDDMAKVS
jgi:hypothetical protein